jgi:adenylosuccinate synthase
MPVTVIVGGQFGSEGKGKVAHCLAKEMGATVAIRVGGPNSGHTVIGPDGHPIIFKQLPTPSLLSGVTCILPAGSYLQLDLLLEEILIAKLTPTRLVIDPNAVIISDRELAVERVSRLDATIGSTRSGTGAAVLARLQRTGAVKFARDEAALRPYVRPATPFLRGRLNNKERVLIEGTQGFGLSVLHTPHYPFATSRDTTAAGFVAEAGLSPLDVDDVVMVIRSFPIRVAGHSGPLPYETSWAEITRESKSPSPLSECTSVTKKERRVAGFDPDIVRQAIAYNRPTRIVLNHLDYVDYECRALERITEKAFSFVDSVAARIRNPIGYVGYGRSKISTVAVRAKIRYI